MAVLGSSLISCFPSPYL